MLFNSFEFLVFFPIVCLVYFALGKNKYRNPFLLIASYYFYMNWNPVYALLILTSTVLTYFCGLLVAANFNRIKRKKLFLTLSLVINFSILFVFKYYNFINESIWDIMSILGLRWNVPNIDLLLPVGISFYTFQAVGYTIDVYRGTIKAEREFGTYALFVSFFPQLVAGPIERAKNLLPQFHREHSFKYENLVPGFKLMLWGFFMKLCVADRLGEYVDAVYNNVDAHNGSSLLIATILFTFQIYCDFGGYSNIAIGVAKILDYDLMVNFRRPYFSESVKDFWRRWHISLSSWFSDYVYIPLGGSRVRYVRHLFNLLVTFLVSGIWHGANWTFVMWGALHGCFLIIHNVFKRITSAYPPLQYLCHTYSSRIIRVMSCFVCIALGWVFFRANNVSDVFTIFSKIFTDHQMPFIAPMALGYGSLSLLILFVKDFADEYFPQITCLNSSNKIISILATACLTIYIILFGAIDNSQFIYFQF